MKQALEFAIAHRGDTWTDLSGNSFKGHYSSKDNKLCLRLGTPVEEGSILKRECSGENYLVTNVGNNTQWLEVSVLLCKKTARIDRPIDSGLNPFGRFDTENLQLVYECVPMALTGKGQKTENTRDQDHTYTVYELATSANFDIRQGDQLRLGNGGSLTVRTADVIDEYYLVLSAFEA